MSNDFQQLPDLESLNELANELFRQPPDADQPGSEPGLPNYSSPPAPGGLPATGFLNQLPQATSLPETPPFKASAPAVAEVLPVPSVVTPRVAPVQAQTPDIHGLQSTVTPMLPDGGGLAAGVPEAYAAHPSLQPDTVDLGGSHGRGQSDEAEAYVPGGSHYYFMDDPAPETGLDASSPENGATAAAEGQPGAPYYFLQSQPQPQPQPKTPKLAKAPEPSRGPVAHEGFDVQALRRDFPILATRVNGGRPLVWLDNAATTHKPRSVIERLSHFYEHENSNIHRAAHELAARATDAYESARKKVADFLGAGSTEEIVFVRGTTEGINLVAQTWGKLAVGEGDEIVLSHLEHHANIVPWQMLAAEKGARIRVIPVDDRGQVRLDEFQKLLNSRTRIVAVTQVSNALGTVVPVKDIIDIAHRAGARVLVDGAQSVSHIPVNVQQLDADFFVFSGHKIFGPTGIGVVYGKRDLLEQMPPYQGGGNMIADVTFDKTTYHQPPTRFEAGTGNIADAVGLGAALDYVQRIGLANIARYEHELLEYGSASLLTVPGLRLVGTAAEKTSVMSFVLDGFTTEEVGQALSEEGIAVRSGHHCAQPILRRYGLETTVRPSIAFYNTHEELDFLTEVLQRLASKRGY